MGSGVSHRSGRAKSPKGAPVAVASDGKFRHPLDVKWDQFSVPAWKVNPYLWEMLRGSRLVPLLDYVDLIDLRFIIENTEAGRPVPRWQDVPRGARINNDNLHRIQWCGDISGLAVLVISYPWLDAEHPDKMLSTMNRLLPFFKAFLESVDREDDHRSTVGLFMDYPCLPQKSIDGHDDRSFAEADRFANGLDSLYEWYIHEHTSVLIYDVDLPGESSGHRNLRPYRQRGWCQFELRASCFEKSASCLWSLKAFEEGGSKQTYRGAKLDASGKVERTAPMLPARFSELVTSGELAFTVHDDIEVVADQYERALERAFAEAVKLNYRNLGWGDEELIALAAALDHAKRSNCLTLLESLDVGFNAWGEAGLIALAEALLGTDCELQAGGGNLSQAGKQAVKQACQRHNVTVSIW